MPISVLNSIKIKEMELIHKIESGDIDYFSYKEVLQYSIIHPLWNCQHQSILAILNMLTYMVKLKSSLQLEIRSLENLSYMV